jgi:hypothetical protein
VGDAVEPRCAAAFFRYRTESGVRRDLGGECGVGPSQRQARIWPAAVDQPRDRREPLLPRGPAANASSLACGRSPVRTERLQPQGLDLRHPPLGRGPPHDLATEDDVALS